MLEARVSPVLSAEACTKRTLPRVEPNEWAATTARVLPLSVPRVYSS